MRHTIGEEQVQNMFCTNKNLNNNKKQCSKVDIFKNSNNQNLNKYIIEGGCRVYMLGEPYWKKYYV